MQYLLADGYNLLIISLIYEKPKTTYGKQQALSSRSSMLLVF